MAKRKQGPDGAAAGVPPRQYQALLMLAEGGSTLEVAERIGVSDRTIRKWRALPEFRAELDALQREATRTAVCALRSQAIHAVNALGRVVQDGDAAPTARVSAARVVLDGIWKAEELDRLDALEARLDLLEGRAEP